MANYSFIDLLTSALGTVAFTVFAFAPGYLVAWLTNLNQFRTRSFPERVLWSVTLSLPLSLVVANLAGRVLSPRITLALFVVVAVGCLVLLLQQWRNRILSTSLSWDRRASIATVFMLGLTLFCLLSVLGIQIGHRLYESSVSQDWNVRTQLVQAAVRGPVPPNNPMFAVAGHAPPLRYYYYWYVLCAQVNRLTGIDAKSSLAASCVWSGFALFACIFLCLKYLAPSQGELRRRCLAALLVACVLGLDVLPNTINLLLPRIRVYPDLEFWHNDRSPGWLGALLWAPHHVAGLMCCVLGILLLVLAARAPSRKQALLGAIFAGVSFAAAAGASTYITAFFVLFCGLLLVDCLWHRDWRMLALLSAAGVFSLVLSVPYIHEMLSSTAVGPSASSKHRLLHLALRSNDQAHYQVNYVLHYFFHQQPLLKASPGQLLLRLPVILGFYIAEFGFFLFVLVDRIRKDFFSGQPPSRDARLLWLLFLSFAIPGFFLTSILLQTNNDLGRHAGMCMRFVLLLWAVPWVIEARQQLRSGVPLPPRRRWTLRFAAIAFALGLATQLWQIVILRIDIPLVDAGRIPPYVVAERFPHIASRFYDMRRAMDAVSAHTAVDGIVQSNPDSRLQPIVSLYLPRQFAAVDDGCNVPFGGSFKDCARIVPPLVALFGGSGRAYSNDPETRPRLPFNAADASPENFLKVCQENTLSAVVALYTDPAWQHPNTWVWQMQPVYANGTARVFLCPPSPSGSAR